MPEKTATFADRLQQALDASGMSRAELARASGVDKSRITRYLQGLYLAKHDAVDALAKALGVSAEWLQGASDDPRPRTDAARPAETRRPVVIPPGFEPVPRMVKKPLIGDIACGDPITAEQNVVDYVEVPEGVNCDFCLRCHGDSMIDAHIQDGDVVYIRCQPEVNDGEIAAVRIGEEATLKRVYYDGHSLTLMPCNTAYRPRTYSGPELNDIQIEGRMVGFTHWGSR